MPLKVQDHVIHEAMLRLKSPTLVAREVGLHPRQLSQRLKRMEARLGIQFEWVKCKPGDELLRNQLAGEAPAKRTTRAAPTFDEKTERQWRDQVFELQAALKETRRNTITDDWVRSKITGLAEDVTKHAPPEWAVNVKRGIDSPGVPCAFWSDWHWGERVFAAQVNGVNEYSVEIAHARAKRIVEKTIYLLRNDVVHPEYPGIVLMLGGDMMSGDIHDELSTTNEMPLMPALLDLHAVLVWAIRSLADEFGNVFVAGVTGNHGRNTRKPVAKHRNFTNFDWLLYQFLANTFKDDGRVQFYIPDGPDAHFSVAGHTFLLTHGDQFRGGDGEVGMLGPVKRGRNRKQTRNSAIDLEFDTMVLGHWHQYTPTMGFIVNGSLKGYDEYANMNNFAFEVPIQALWLVHPQHGITRHMPVYAEERGPRSLASEWVAIKKIGEAA